MSMADLSEVSTEDLVAEVKRRIECSLKPEKRVILIGTCMLLFRGCKQ